VAAHAYPLGHVPVDHVKKVRGKGRERERGREGEREREKQEVSSIVLLKETDESD